MQFTIVIPARFASTRLPGKPLIDIAGKPMIEWVWLRAIDSKASRVVVATDDQRILEICRDKGYMTAIIATSTIVHATPASYYSKVKSLDP